MELYNAGDDDVDLIGWSIVPSQWRNERMIADLDRFLGYPLDPNVDPWIIPAKGFYVVTAPEDEEEEWLDPRREVLILKNHEGFEVDRTPRLIGRYRSGCSWGRYPDGSDVWSFMRSTRGGPNSGDACEEALYSNDSLRFKNEQSITGSGYVHTRTSISSGSSVNITYAGALKSTEHGSGTYDKEESTSYFADLYGGYDIIGLNRYHSVRYEETAVNVTPRRSVKYDSRWAESSLVRNLDNPNYIAKSHRYATRIDSDMMIGSDYSDLSAKIESDFEGSVRIESNLYDFASSEEYTGSFRIYGDYQETDYTAIESSVSGVGFVRKDKSVNDTVATYERGTGKYEIDELINTANGSLSKDASLVYAPVTYSYSPDRTVDSSMMWRGGTRAVMKDNSSFTSFSGEFSDISRLEEEVFSSSGSMKTSADFSGTARLRTIYIFDLDEPSNIIYIDDEYAGDYSIEWQVRTRPKYLGPHLSITTQGELNQPGCDLIRYTITLINEGNTEFEPVYIRDTFPVGTKYVDSNLQPVDIGDRYAAWLVPIMRIGGSETIVVDLMITERKDNYTNRVSAQTLYQLEIGNTTRDRRLVATDTFVSAFDWTGCNPQIISASFDASYNSNQPRILTYHMTVQNLAEEDMRFNITASLPKGTKFINTTNPNFEIIGDQIKWTINRLPPSRRTPIRFIVEAPGDGLYVSTANILGSSLDGGELGSVEIGASALVGEFEADLYLTRQTEEEDWLYCDEGIAALGYWDSCAGPQSCGIYTI